MEQVRQGLDDEDKSLFLNAFATANPLSLLNCHVWDAHGWRQHQAAFLGHRWRNSFLNPSKKQNLAFEWDLRDIDGAIHF